MQYRELADTGAEAPEIGLGTWQYRGGVAPLRRGLELGANLIDTAESYSTETVVGEAVRGMREQVLLATKVSPSHFRRGDLLRAADQSLKRLGTDYIDLYQLHWPNPSIPIEETMGAMNELVDAGKVRFIGVSNFSVDQMRTAQSVSEHKIVSNQVRYSLVSREIERDVLPYCQENNLTVIAYSPLGHNMSRFRSMLGGALEEVARITGKTEAQVALNWCISHDNVIAIPKSNSVEHTEENCLASDWRLTAEQMSLLESVSLV